MSALSHIWVHETGDGGIKQVELPYDGEICRKNLPSARRIVVKAGTNVIVSQDPNSETALDLVEMDQLVGQLSDIRTGHYDGGPKEVLLVTSGALGAGLRKLGLKEVPKGDYSMQGAITSVGQSVVWNNYHEIFKHKRAKMGILTPIYEDLIPHFKEVVEDMFVTDYVIPLINYNDACDEKELKKEEAKGGNDELAARVARLIGADLLIFLTNTAGVYDGIPGEPDSKLISRISVVDEYIMGLAKKGHVSKNSIGGMNSKLATKKTFLGDVVIVDGRRPNVLFDVLAGKEVGTYISGPYIADGQLNLYY